MVDPSNGTLKAVGTWGEEPVRSTSTPSPAIRTVTFTGRRLPRLRPSSSMKPSAAYSPSGIFASSRRSAASE